MTPCPGCGGSIPRAECCPVVELPDWFTLDSWVTADHHFGHRNIQRYQNRPGDHEGLMIREWHRTVTGGDPVLHLGDLVVYSRWDKWEPILAGLPGRKLLLRGNHDREGAASYARAGFRLLTRRPILWHDPVTQLIICFSHEPAACDGSWDVNVHGHVHGSAPLRTPVPGTAARIRVNVSVEATDYGPMRLRDILAFGAGVW